MRIAFLDSWLQSSAEGSGTAVAIGGLQQALQAQGHHVARMSPWRAWPPSLMLRRFLFNVASPALLARLPYDLLVGFDIDGFLLPASSRHSFIASIKGVLAEEARHEQGRTRRLLWLLSRLERRNARRAAAVLTTSHYCRRAICQQYGVAEQRIGLVPEGIDLARWPAHPAAAQPPRDGTLILCVARQYPRKRIADLLHALPAVRRAVPRVRAVIVGDGPEHARLQCLAHQLHLGDCVHLPGALPDDALRRLYQRADIFCLPSVQEGFGIVFLEAMASALPIVATTAAAVPEVVPQQQAGVLVPPRNSAALADALIALLHDEERRAAYAAFGRAHVQRYAWERVAAQFLAQVAVLL